MQSVFIGMVCDCVINFAVSYCVIVFEDDAIVLGSTSRGTCLL